MKIPMPEATLSGRLPTRILLAGWFNTAFFNRHPAGMKVEGTINEDGTVTLEVWRRQKSRFGKIHTKKVVVGPEMDSIQVASDNEDLYGPLGGIRIIDKRDPEVKANWESNGVGRPSSGINQDNVCSCHGAGSPTALDGIFVPASEFGKAQPGHYHQRIALDRNFG